MSVMTVSLLLPLVGPLTAIIVAGIVAVIVLKHKDLDEYIKVGILAGVGVMIFFMVLITVGTTLNYGDKFHEIRMKELDNSIQLLD